MVTPNDHANTVRVWLKKLPTNGVPLAALDALEAERDAAVQAAEQARNALKHLSEPNWGAKPTGKDAVEMSSFARDFLAREQEPRS